MLRPLRLAYLVDPNDAGMVRRAIEASTCRWGGMASAIVPRYRRRPPSFADSRLSAKEIVSGYLATFEPDFVVEGEDGAASGLGLDERYIGSLDSLESPDRRDNLPWGLSALLLYREAYSREFRFLQRNPLDAVLPYCESSGEQLLVDALLGALPTSGPLGYMASAYEEAFDPTKKGVDGSSLHELMLSATPVLTPLRVAMRDLRRERGVWWRREPVFMLVRPTRSADIVDFWNIRALGAKIAAVPCGNIAEFVEAYKKLSDERNLNPSFRYEEPHHAVALRAQGVDPEELEAFGKAMAEAGFPLIKQPWFPSIWDPSRLQHNSWSRAPIEADSDRIEVGAPDGQLRFAPLSPSLSEETSGSTPSWANVIRLQDWSWSSDLAAVMPPGLSDMTRLLNTVGQHPPTASSEGIVIRVDWPKMQQRWTLPRGPSVFSAWLAVRGFEVCHSPAGRTAEQVITTLGGPTMAALVQEPQLIQLINQAASGLVEQTTSDLKAQPRRRVIRWADLHRVLREISDNSEERAQARLARLVETRVLRQGLMVRCSLCEQENWFSLDALATELTCERCLRKFDFPRDRPPSRKRWAYRPNGPFSIDNFAEGGYAVALALRFFLSQSTFHDEATWTTSMSLTSSSGELEFDFGIWLRDDGNRGEVPKLVFGECKSFGRFEDRDLKRTVDLASAFPECLTVLSTLRDDLDEDEKQRIREIVDDNEELGTGRLMVLTANELCNADAILGPPYSWRGKGGKFDEAAERFDRGRFGLETLGRATLALYCDVRAS